jgi:peptidyl-prolyl cis-trans isomerase SurA
MKFIKTSILFIFLLPLTLFSQERVLVDKIIAVIGGTQLLQSDIESQNKAMIEQRANPDRCQIFENFLVQKLVVNQAKIDSVEVTEDQVETELNGTLDYYISQAGSKEKLEEYYKKSIYQIKEDMRGPMRERLIVRKMQQEITGNTKITPTEVKDFYDQLPKDSIPLVNSQVEYLQILKYPPYAEQSIYEIKKDLLSLRKRILDGEKFSTLAYLYSEDPGTARLGGEVGFRTKSELDPEYSKAAMNLKMNAVSNIVESQFGYHIIQLIGRDGDRFNTRHILKKPKASDEEVKQALSKLDSIVHIIKADSISFENAAIYFSDDKNTRLSGGKVINPYTGSTKFDMDQLTQEDYYIIKNLKVGDISEPFMSKDENRKDAFKVIKLLSKTEPHKANLVNDYQMIQDMALAVKKQKVFEKWVEEKRKTTYIRLDPSYKSCEFKNKNWYSKE